MKTRLCQNGWRGASRSSGRGFTMIELLVVFGVIAVLAGLILTGAGHAASKKILTRAQSDLASVESALGAYKAEFGYYPHDNPTNTAGAALFYELAGTVITLDSGTPPSPSTYYCQTSGETLKAADIKNLFGVDGFANANTVAAQTKNVASGLRNSEQLLKTVTAGVTSTVLGVNVPGPRAVPSVDGKKMVPWNYVATNPTNNPATYDLWVDITYAGKTYRVSNWSKEPQPL